MSSKDVMFISYCYHIVECSGASKTENAATGEIKSINYPANYDNNLNCQWRITVPGDLITFEVVDIDTEYVSNQCTSDSVRVSITPHLSFSELIPSTYCIIPGRTTPRHS